MTKRCSNCGQKLMVKDSPYITKDAVDYYKLRFLNSYLIGHKGYIGGGCFKNIFNGEEIKDVDIFFESEKDQISAKKYYEDNENYKSAYHSDKVDAFKNKNTGIVVELVKSNFNTPENMLDTFDFTITKMVLCAFEVKSDSDDEVKIEHKVIYHKNFFEDLLTKRLIIDCKDTALPLSVFNRTLRYSKYGYTMCRNSKLYLVNEILKYARNRNLEKFSLDDFTRELYDGLD